MAKLSEKQKAKRNFRNSKAWKNFRHEKNVEQKGLDPITECKLTKTAEVHHKILDEDKYKDISDKDNFIMINSSTHDTIHWCLRYIKKYGDLRVLDALYKEVEKEALMNGFLSNTIEGESV